MLRSLRFPRLSYLLSAQTKQIKKIYIYCARVGDSRNFTNAHRHHCSWFSFPKFRRCCVEKERSQKKRKTSHLRTICCLRAVRKSFFYRIAYKLFRAHTDFRGTRVGNAGNYYLPSSTPSAGCLTRRAFGDLQKVFKAMAGMSNRTHR